MTKEEYLLAAAARYDELQALNKLCISPLNTWREILQMLNFKFVGLWHVKNGQPQKSWQF
jgi:hypothetical protein